jgi:hypothetical protein
MAYCFQTSISICAFFQTSSSSIVVSRNKEHRPLPPQRHLSLPQSERETVKMNRVLVLSFSLFPHLSWQKRHSFLFFRLLNRCFLDFPFERKINAKHGDRGRDETRN